VNHSSFFTPLVASRASHVFSEDAEQDTFSVPCNNIPITVGVKHEPRCRYEPDRLGARRCIFPASSHLDASRASNVSSNLSARLLAHPRISKRWVLRLLYRSSRSTGSSRLVTPCTGSALGACPKDCAYTSHFSIQSLWGDENDQIHASDCRLAASSIDRPA